MLFFSNDIWGCGSRLTMIPLRRGFMTHSRGMARACRIWSVVHLFLCDVWDACARFATGFCVPAVFFRTSTPGAIFLEHCCEAAADFIRVR